MNNDFPRVTDVERNLLSAMLLEKGAAIPRVVPILEPEDFYAPENRLIYEAILAVFNRGEEPHLLLVREELEKRGVFKRINHMYFISLPEAEFSTALVERYAKIIKDKALLRRLIEVGQEIIQTAKDDRNTSETVLEAAEQKLFALRLNNRNKDFEHIKPVAMNSYNRLRFLFDHQGEMTGIPTGLLDVDKLTNGFQRSDMIILAARPSMGKTALALNMAAGAAKKGYAVAVFSLEMSKMQIGNRLLSLESGVNSQSLNSGRFSREEMNDLTDALVRLEDLPLYIDDTAGIGLLEMRAKVQRLQLDVKLDFIVIDYLQLMQGTRTENRQQEISDISRGLKSLAKEMNVPILVLSQLNRSVELRAEKKPQLSDLRESGSLEQDADMVIFLYRDEYYNRDEAESQNLAEVIIAKNRNGPTTSIMMQFTKETMKFNDLTRVEP